MSSDVQYEPVIGLEIHVQLRTNTKMFCSCPLSFGEEPNTRTCPRCLGLPGTLPVANAEAIHYGLMIGMAVGSELAPRSIFHRKNYFYPDLPKWIASALATGSVPGRPRQRGHVRVLGCSPKLSGQEQNIFVFVRSWTWISRPMTGSYWIWSVMRAPPCAPAIRRSRSPAPARGPRSGSGSR